MKTLLDASAQEKLSPSCREALRRSSADRRLHALLRPFPAARAPKVQLSPEPIDDAIRSAGAAVGRGSTLIQDLRADLEARSKSLRPWVEECTDLWLADALAVHLPAVELAKLSHRPDVRWIDLQPEIRPARRIGPGDDDPEKAVDCGLHLEIPNGLKPKIALVDTVSSPEGSTTTFAEAWFDATGRPCPGHPRDERGPADSLAGDWQHALAELVPDAHWLRAGVFHGDKVHGDEPATYAQIVAGLQWSLERGADLVILDLGAAALDPIWHLPILHCTLYGTAVVVAGMERRHKDRGLWPVHVPLAGCFDRGPLRTDLMVSGAPLGRRRLTGSLAAAARAAAAITLLQTVAPRLKNDPAALVGPLFAGPRRGAAPGGEVELDPASMLKAVSSAA